MEKQKLILPKHLFWDVVYEDIDFDEKERFVIERVFDRGNRNKEQKNESFLREI